MRVNRPALAAAWAPFFSSSPSFSQHATDSIMSLQSKEPLPGHPTTLRDLTAISDVLMLPASFGAIQLGETFSSCLCINNDTDGDVHAVALKVEMQTATTKVLLAHLGGPDLTLTAEKNFVETVVHHEIKELGQHVLSCTITYRLPGAPPANDEDGLSTIRKYYKFAVTNPLSVKTKVHTPRAPSALLSRTEREKVFLEVHVQNLTAEPLWFEQMKFECADGWLVDDANLTSHKTSIFSGAAALIQPQDLRQYVYVLTPTPESVPSFPVVHAPGTVISLGRLDISWRSSFGGPGRLLTSMLSRRIPMPAAAPPASALPPHLQRARRPGSPTPSIASTIGTPPGSPFRARTVPQRPLSRPHSPAPSIASPTPTFASLSQAAPIHLPVPAPAPTAPIDLDLVVLDILRDAVARDTPFSLRLALTLATLPPRAVVLAVQHVQPFRPPPTHTALSAALASRLTLTGPPSRASTPSPTPTIGGRSSVIISRAPSVSGTDTLVESPLVGTFHQASAPGSVAGASGMPSPHALEETGRAPPSDGVLFLGASSYTLPPFVFARPEPVQLQDEPERPSGEEGGNPPPSTPPPRGPTPPAPPPSRQELTKEFELSFIATKPGFATIGGLRVVLLSDEERSDAPEPAAAQGGDARILKEWDIVGEIFVS
ncbi:DUF974-domain-containing protein [Auricularia subglabra TFB-10046 SS5]|nr:DUF974-domain-containing protein [Auricularia subglabra TFB-10046 SS5]